MKFILSLLLLINSTVYAGTCTTISRTNNASLSVLTSTKYNTDHNTSYAAINSFDGGCVQSNTLEYDALNTTQFAPLLKGIKEGCKVSYSNASTVSIGKCYASVNGNFVYTSGATTASFGCSGCSAEVASTDYYVYIQTGSSGTTLTPLISTTTPNADGYDNSGNKVLGKFRNNGSSDINEYSIYNWLVNDFVLTSTWTKTCRVNYSGGWVKDTVVGQCDDWVASVGQWGATGNPTVNFKSGVFSAKPTCVCSGTDGIVTCGPDTNSVSQPNPSTSRVALEVYSVSGAALANSPFEITCTGKR